MLAESNAHENHSEFVINPCEDPEYKRSLENVLKAVADLTTAIGELHCYSNVIKVTCDYANRFHND